MLRLGSTKVCYTLLLALAVIDNSSDASAAEACTTLRHQQRRLSTWVSDCLISSERTIQLLICSPRGPGLFCALFQGCLLFMTYGARPTCSIWAPKLLSAVPELHEHFRRAARRKGGWAICCSTALRSVLARCGRWSAERLPSMSPAFRVAHKDRETES